MIVAEPRASAPLVRVSRAAVVANVRAALREHPSAAVDVRRDACGHGARLVADAALEAGAAYVLSDADSAADRHGRDVLALEAVFGLEGRGTPALALTGPVLSIKPLFAGEGVSYGYLHRAERDTRVALVSGGYAHGVARAIGGRAMVRIGGAELPIIGRVAMDVCVVDLEDADVAPGDRAVFLGPDHPDAAATWARATGLTELELVAAVGLHTAREVTA
ncbi:alanine racemase C-terminal domain-containing protein [Microbacterium cremeum]|uniref:alanine racemase C-terminal domain-containing protein n=1 Tax=Microbacterium cremeum TaxID=2782169 RepID=UPI0018879C09|nr:alanine racemase C-terminal domain-containing protein [Microbacterium cremeum]